MSTVTKKRRRGRPTLPWEYWEDLRRFGIDAGVWRKQGETYGLKRNKEREKIIQQLESQYPTVSSDPTENLVQTQKYFRALLQLPQTKELWEAFRHPRRHLVGLQRACQKIMEDGPLRWISSNGTVVAKISDWKTLRVRIIESYRRDPIYGLALRPWTTELWQGGKLLRGKRAPRRKRLAR